MSADSLVKFLVCVFIFIFVSDPLLIWLSKKSGDERFCKIASRKYVRFSTPWDVVITFMVYWAAYKAAPRSVIGVVAMINIIAWCAFFSGLIYFFVNFSDV